MVESRVGQWRPPPAAHEPHARAVVDRPDAPERESAREALDRTRADQLYVALPLEDHARLVPLVTGLSNECVDIKVVPDVVQYATIKDVLEDLDGIPIISLNEVPLQGWSSMTKRLMDLAVSSALLLGLTLVPVLPVLALLVRLLGGKGRVLLRQERMTLDGKTFQIYKFRTMVDEAEKETGPVFATSDDPRRTPIGAWLRRHNLDELPQLLNVLLGDMSLVGPRLERPPFVQQFRERIPGPEEPAAQRIYEDEFVAHFKYRGINAVPGYAVVPGEELAKKEVLDEKLKSQGFDALLLTQVTGTKTELVQVPGTVNYQPMYSPMYQPAPYYRSWPGYYNAGYTAMYTPSYTAEDFYIMTETSLFDVASEKLFWSAAAATRIGGKDQKLIKDYVATMRDAMRKDKVVP